MAKRNDTDANPAAPADEKTTAITSIPVPALDVEAVAPKIELATVEAITIDVPNATTPGLDSLERDAIKHDTIKPVMVDDAAVPPPAATAAAAAAPPHPVAANSNRFALLAASVAVAACIGATGGVLGASGIARLGPTSSVAVPAPIAAAEDIRALQSTIAQLRTDLAALKTSVEAGTKAANGQFAKITERLDRAQSDQAARTVKAKESFERPDKRADATPAKEITGSVSPQPAVASPPAPQPIVSGWVVRDVYRGVAFIQGRIGLIEVEAGDVVPGIGRIEAIRKQDGRWVVITSKGLIASAR